jgi:hypothetical protein
MPHSTNYSNFGESLPQSSDSPIAKALKIPLQDLFKFE